MRKKKSKGGKKRRETTASGEEESGRCYCGAIKALFRRYSGAIRVLLPVPVAKRRVRKKKEEGGGKGGRPLPVAKRRAAGECATEITEFWWP